jgi:hypothetical protein
VPLRVQFNLHVSLRERVAAGEREREQRPASRRDRSHSLSESTVLTGDIPWLIIGQDFLFSGAEGSSRTKSREFFLRLPEKITKNQGEKKRSSPTIRARTIPKSWDETLGSDSIFSDLDLNNLVNSKKWEPPLLLRTSLNDGKGATSLRVWEKLSNYVFNFSGFITLLV